MVFERRTEARRRAFALGRIGPAGGPADTDCVVRDLSEGGALLLLDAPERAPTPLALTTERGGPARPARVVWRGERRVGIAFALRSAAEGAGAVVVSLAAARRERDPGPDARRLAERIAAVLRPRPRPAP